MKNISKVMLIGLCLILASTACAADKESNGVLDSTHVLPVLVAVDKTGKVIKVDPAIRMKAVQERNLRSMVDGMITGPALKDGHGIYSQFVMLFALDKAADSNSATLRYLSSKPTRPEPMHWVREHGGSGPRFALRPVQNSSFNSNKPGGFVPAPPPAPTGGSGR